MRLDHRKIIHIVPLNGKNPFLKLGGLDLDLFFTGTINISIAPLKYKLVKPAYTFRQIGWTGLHPPEDFSFSPCRVLFQAMGFDGYIYYPHPETKIRHFQAPSVIEVITDKIPGIGYGSQVELSRRGSSNPDHVRVRSPIVSATLCFTMNFGIKT